MESGSDCCEPTPTNEIKDVRIELKYAISPTLADEIRCWAREHMEPDCNADCLSDDTYGISSIYLDTPNFDIFHRNSDVTKRKHRLRRYGSNATIWVETKRKSKDIVRKKRTAISAVEIDKLTAVTDFLNLPTEAENSTRITNDFAAEAFAAEWFRQRVQKHHLRPSTLVSYERFARIGQLDTNPIRLTIDSQITGQKVDDWYVPAYSQAGDILLEEQQLLELKFQDVLPPLFKSLLLTFPLELASFSKYRTAVSRCRSISNLDRVA